MNFNADTENQLKGKQSKMTDESDFTNQIDNNQNKNSIHCQFCNSVILKAKVANYTENEVSQRFFVRNSFVVAHFFLSSQSIRKWFYTYHFFEGYIQLRWHKSSFIYFNLQFNLPLMHQKNKESVVESENLRNYWTVDDMFKFENIGFSNTLQNTKYLICADCEMGPVGYHDIASKKCFVALKRVKHVE